jgi:hypothetical protein
MRRNRPGLPPGRPPRGGHGSRARPVALCALWAHPVGSVPRDRHFTAADRAHSAEFGTCAASSAAEVTKSGRMYRTGAGELARPREAAVDAGGSTRPRGGGRVRRWIGAPRGEVCPGIGAPREGGLPGGGGAAWGRRARGPRTAPGMSGVARSCAGLIAGTCHSCRTARMVTPARPSKRLRNPGQWRPPRAQFRRIGPPGTLQELLPFRRSESHISAQRSRVSGHGSAAATALVEVEALQPIAQVGSAPAAHRVHPSGGFREERQRWPVGTRSGCSRPRRLSEC